MAIMWSSSSADSSKKKRRSFALWKTNNADSRDDVDKEQKILLTSQSDKIVSSRLHPSNVVEAPFMLSPDTFVGVSHDIDSQRLRDNIRRMRKAPSGFEPKNVDAAYDVYKNLREESFDICARLLQKSQNSGRDESLKAEIAPLDTRTSHSAQESLLEGLRGSLLATYKSYEPDASDNQIHAFFTDKTLRANLIARMRETIYAFGNYDRLEIEVEASEKLFAIANSGTAPNMAIKEYVIAKDGDAILEFANAASEIHPILRFRVSSHLLAATSPLFFQMLSDPQQLSSSQSVSNGPLDMLSDPAPPGKSVFRDGTEVKLYRMPQVELNNNEALTILLHAAHMHHRKVPREIEFPVFVSIAEVCLRYRCTQPLELQVEYQWLPQWLHMAGSDDPEGLLLISYTFGLRRLFTRMSKTAILTARSDEDIQSKELWPQAIRDKIKAIRAAKLAQIHECCQNAIEGYLRPPLDHNIDRRGSVGSLVFTTVPRCPKGSHLCDATNLGWIMLVYNELRMLPNIMKSVDLHNLTNAPRRSLQDLCDCLRLMPSAPQAHTGICDYAPAFRSAINDISNSISGLTLGDVSGRNGWALSQHAGPIDDQHEDLPKEGLYKLPAALKPKNEQVSMLDDVALQILSLVDNLDDLQSAAMINKSFYSAYERNEVVLLRSIARAERRRRRTVAQTSPDIEDPDDLYNATPPLSSVTPTMSPEVTSRIGRLNEELNGTVVGGRGLESNDKYLMGEVAQVENKARLVTNTKFLREEQDKELGILGNFF